MKKEDTDSTGAKLGALLRESRVSPTLPPRFQENVWRRIESAEAPSVSTLSWLDALAALVLRPRFALATATVLIAAGAIFGAYSGDAAANHAAQAQYIVVVAPSALR